ncbi:wax ester/triacylglycerol synthase domain-containing protein [Streptomyces sp. YS415]|uniref:wax ester/triacylglycerol synthase domain-containing protein n=1 Tax=Streptomyces sp. YS415 TaxID=2944806 RepID=UPI002021A8E1|nr:wax ester/triacylglycerol synthase domain-containing protein [Streptomyces sp. YS415]MCL7428967.1 hypothetical protein [Streptomyces sp. YS415]
MGTRLSVLDEGHVRTGLPETIGLAALFSGPPPAPAEMQCRVADRWSGLERMNLVLRPPAGPAALTGHRWERLRAFDPAAHVTVGDQALEPLLATAVEHRLPVGRPLWRLVVAPNAVPGGEHAVVLLAHHALLDGRSLESVFRLLMDNPPPRRRRGATPTRPAVPPAALWRELRKSCARAQSLPPGTHGDVEPSLAVLGIDPQVVRAARRRLAEGRGATLNELLVSSFAGALRACYGPLHGWPEGPIPFHVTVPVDLRDGHTAHRLGNAATTVRVPLPVDTECPDDRLRTVQNQMAALPSRADVHRAALPVLESAGRLLPWLTHAMARHGVRADVTASGCTTFKWRDVTASLCGRPLTRIIAVPKLSPPGTANLCLVQTGDAYTLTVVGHLRPDAATALARATARALAEPAVATVG